MIDSIEADDDTAPGDVASATLDAGTNTEDTGSSLPTWHPVTRVLFRFFCAYFVIYNLPFPFQYIPFVSRWTAGPYGEFWNAAVPWIGEHVLHLATPITIRPAGSGDTTWNYVQLLAFVVLALVITIVWTVLDRRRREYATLHRWLRVNLRFVLGMTMCGYGAFKVIKSQFPFPMYEQLLEPYGRSSPMALLWTFMGYSPAYNIFAGLGEMIGGVLMFFRRTVTAGAILLIVVMGNVVILNFAYDVPVKLYSANLLAQAIFLLVPDVRRLFSALVLGHAVEAKTIRPLFGARWKNRVAQVAGVLFAVYALFTTLKRSAASRSYGDARPQAPIHGMWEVDEFARNGAVLPPLVTDTMRWRRMVVSTMSGASVVLMSDSVRRYGMRLDSATHSFAMIRAAKDTVARLAYELPDADHLVLNGLVGGDTVRARLRRVDDSSLLLVSRGFHWINEFPYNR
jgi:hypothetical protein